MSYKYDPYRDTYEHVDDEQTITVADTKSWLVEQCELTDECIEKIADAVARKMRGEEDV